MTNFWDALELVEDIVAEPIEYRLYYDELGEPLYYTTEKHNGDCIVVSKEVYDEARYDIAVIHGEISKTRKKYATQRLVPLNSNKGTECLIDDISIVGKGQHWTLKRYE